MLRFLYVLTGFCLLFSGCRPRDSKTVDAYHATALPSPEWTASQAVNEEALLLRLAANLRPEPKNEVERGKNEATEWVLEQNWDMQTTHTGLLYQVVEAGTGENVRWGDRLEVHYEGAFTDGQVFDSSYQRGKALEFYVGNMIPGWNEGLSYLREGGKGIFVIPPHLGYGHRGLQDRKGHVLVPPDKVLVFKVYVQRIIERAPGE